MKFTDHGLLRFRVRQRDGGYSFDVADTGPGIAASEIPHIFDAFTQVGEAVFAPSDGTGLGLTIARELAQVMGGNIRVSSVEGVGSRFVFTALLEALPADEIPDDARRAYRVQTMPAQLRVLLVEDNDVNALIADSQLQSLGIYAQRVRDGLEAVNAALAEPRPDLVLMDCQMPVMNGLAASREIRAREAAGDLRNVPIVAVTAMTSAESVAKQA